jgi:ribose 5-phosphate isomerase B
MIYLSSDHKGVSLRKALFGHLQTLGFECQDMGPQSEERVNYTDFAAELCQKLDDGKPDFGILICGTGIGMSIAANRYKHIRAALCTTEYHAQMTRMHNDANVLCLGSNVTAPEHASVIAEAFIVTAYEAGRHQVRVDALGQLG